MKLFFTLCTFCAIAISHAKGQTNDVTRDDVQSYISQCKYELIAEIERTRGKLPAGPERAERIRQLMRKPYFARLHMDFQPTVGAIGVLATEVAAKVVKILNESEMVVELSWQGDKFTTKYSRRVLMIGQATDGMKAGDVVPLPGIYKVMRETECITDDGRKCLTTELLAIDITRHVEEAFYKSHRGLEQQQAPALTKEMDMARAKEFQASNLLRVARDYLAAGEQTEAVGRMQRIIDVYPGTDAAKQAADALTSVGVKPRESLLR